MRWPTFRQGLTLNYLLMVLATSAFVILGVFRFINLLGIKFFYLYSPNIVNLVVFSPEVDFWIWVSSLIIIAGEVLLMRALRIFRLPLRAVLFSLLALLVLTAFLINDWIGSFFGVLLGLATAAYSLYYGFGAFSKRKTIAMIFCCIVGFALFFEVASLTTWLWNVVDYSFPFSSMGHWRFALFDMQLSNVFYPLTWWLFVVLLFGWFWIPLFKAGFLRLSALKHWGQQLNLGFGFGSGKLSRRTLVIGLLLSIAVGVFVAYYPWVHLSGSNLAGSDSLDYYNWLQDMAQKGPSFAWQTDRPIVLLLLNGVQSVGNLSSEAVVRIMPMICAAGLCLAVFWFVRVGLKNDTLALVAAFFSAVSFQLLVSISAYSLANWVALIEGFVLFGLLLKSFEKRSWMYALAASFLGMTLLLTHPYTWDIFMVVILAYAVGTVGWTVLKKNTLDKAEVLSVVLVLASNLMFFVVYGLLPFGSQVTGGGAGMIGYIAPGAALFDVPSGLARMVQFLVSGAFANPLLLLLAIAGAFCFMDFSKRFDRLLILLVAVPSLILFKVSPEDFLYYRLVYLVPVQILSAAGICWISNFFEVYATPKTGKWGQFLKIGLIVLVVLFLLNFALRLADGIPLKTI